MDATISYIIVSFILLFISYKLKSSETKESSAKGDNNNHSKG